MNLRKKQAKEKLIYFVLNKNTPHHNKKKRGCGLTTIMITEKLIQKMLSREKLTLETRSENNEKKKLFLNILNPLYY
jgi:hypothetical protein